MIIIAGDSWGCGGWGESDNTGPNVQFGIVTHWSPKII
jgi:hypothetical protein